MPDPQHTRRDFLRGRSALGAASHVVEQTLDKLIPAETSQATSPEKARTGHRVIVLERRAMACAFELRLNGSNSENATEAGMAALDLVEQLEDQLTVYRDHSELIDLNRRAAEESVRVEAGLFELLKLASRLGEETRGAFDLTSGPLSRVWGFSQREGKIPSPKDLDVARALVSWKGVHLNESDQTVRFDRPGMELNVNSIGKGYALDRAGRLLAERGVSDSLMHGGRSTLLARGSNRGLESDGWLAGVRDPLHPDRRVAEFVLRDEALSSSGGGTQFFEQEGRRYGHVIDPRTGWPAEELLLATAIAPTAAEADALSTAFCTMGVSGTERFCEARPDVGALLLAPADRGETVRYAFNLTGRDGVTLF